MTADGPDTFTKVEQISWGSRLMSSITGVLVGIILFLVAFPLLFWNEGRAVRCAKGIAQGRRTVASVSAEKVDPANEGKLVHFAGRATTEETLRDPDFGAAENALRLLRDVQMYQWVEEKHTKSEKHTGGSETRTTTYTYTKQWRKERIESEKFGQPAGHANPGMAVSPASWQAGAVKVGGFSLPAQLVGALPARDAVAAPQTPPSAGPASQAKAWAGGYYIGADPNQPQIGDLKIAFLAAHSMEVSVVGRQIGESVGPFLTNTRTELFRIEPGLIPADVMFQHAATENAILTWVLRAAGFLAMFIGLALVFKPLVTLADVLPILGSLLGVGTGLAAFALAAPLTLLTIGLAWLAYRPLLSAGIAVVAVSLFVLLRKLGGRRRAAAPAAATAR